MDFDDREDTRECLLPGDWVALWRGRIVAHGAVYLDVALEACRQAPDAVMARLPALPAWEPDCPPWA
jgi:hypothetical protein